MTDEERGMSEPGRIDLDASTTSIRESMASLGTLIESLRDEADGLLERAAGRTVLSVLDRAAEMPSRAEVDDIAAMEDSIAAIGRHAADVPDEFDPRPYDPDDDDEDEADPVLEADVLRDVAAAPAFESIAEADAQLPALDVPERATPLEANEPQTNLAPQEPAPTDDDGGHVADVIAFTPRTPTPDRLDAPAAPEPPADDEPAFGFLSTELDAPENRPSPPTQQAAAAPVPRAATADGLDAIAASGSTEVPANWNGPSPDDDAFDKFFSADVEPEPAQRWLLNE